MRLATFGQIVQINWSLFAAVVVAAVRRQLLEASVSGYFWAGRADKLVASAAVAVAVVRRQLMEASVCVCVCLTTLGPIVPINWLLLLRLPSLLFGGSFWRPVCVWLLLGRSCR